MSKVGLLAGCSRPSQQHPPGLPYLLAAISHPNHLPNHSAPYLAAGLAGRALVGDAQAWVQHAAGLRPPLRHLHCGSKGSSEGASASVQQPSGWGAACSLVAAALRLLRDHGIHLVQCSLIHMELCRVDDLGGAHQPKVNVLAATASNIGAGTEREQCNTA